MLVVWEPVLPTDIAPPTTSTLGRLHDHRVAQFWDGDKMLSQAFLDMARTHPERMNEQERAQLAATDVVWDFIACFGPEAKWQEDLPMPEYSKAPVVNAIDDFVRWLNGDTADERRGEDDESDRANPAKPVPTSAARAVPFQERLRLL